MEKQIKDMTLDELRLFVNRSELDEGLRMAVKDRLGAIMWDIGNIWDTATGVAIKPYAGTYGGTGNHRSMTYKLRKLAGYSYP